MTPPQRPHKWFTIALFALIVLSVALRFWNLEADPPYGIISDSGAFLTDEGWYSKSAQLHVKTGEWTNEHDYVWRSHNALFTMLQVGVFQTFGISVGVARSLSVFAFVLSLLAFYGICRTVMTRTMALTSCLIVSITLQNFAYSRMALIEPVGTAFAIGGLWMWVRFGRDGGAPSER